MTQTQSIEAVDKNFAAPRAAEGLLWHDIRGLTVEGLGWLGQERIHPFDRLPARAKPLVREDLWLMSEYTTGVSVRFVTDALEISAKWSLRNPRQAMPHMPATGVSGLDLYVRDGSRWRWVGLGRPAGVENAGKLLEIHPPADGGIDGKGGREYLLYLPLFNSAASVELGLPENATLSTAPPWPAGLRIPGGARPILFYGTSITHGGCAARPGMAYPSIISRSLDRPIINLGFSGTGWMELEVGQLIAELDPSVYVLDNLPNMTGPQVTSMVEPLVNLLRGARPQTPIVLVENPYPTGTLAASRLPGEKNILLRAAYGRLLAAGVKNLHLMPGEYLLGLDGEATVDGGHPTDMGFLRMAAAMLPLLRPLV